MSESAATGPLFDEAVLWEVRSTIGADAVISAAVNALVAGIDSPSLRELAGASSTEDYWTLQPLVQAALEELGIPYPDSGSHQIQIAAARVMCRRLLEGNLAADDFAAWAHRTIGHEGAAILQPLVELDDVFVVDCTIDTIDDLEAAARRVAESLLSGEPLPTPIASSQPDTTTTAVPAAGRSSALAQSPSDSTPEAQPPLDGPDPANDSC